MSIPEYLIVANPVSGKGRGRSVGEKVRRRLAEKGISVRLTFTEERGHGRVIAAEAVRDGVQRLVACGGDGTVHEVVSAAAGSNAVVGIVPCGTGNDLARVLNLPKEAALAADLLVEGQVRQIDLGRVGDRYFCTVAMVGFDAEVALSIHENGKPFGGTAAYIFGMLKTLLTYRAPEMQLTGDFGTVAGRVFLSAAGNTSTYGGGMRIVPSAVCDDGVLDICIVHHMPRWRVLLLFPLVFFGSHVNSASVEILRTERLRIESSTPMWIFGDGEPLCKTPATITVVCKALNVICPGDVF